MALQSSGAISFANLQTEFGGSHPITMGEYSSFSGIGATSEVSLDDFYGLSASHTVTEGSSGSTVHGYVLASSVGSISPTTFYSVTIRALFSLATTVKGSTSYGVNIYFEGNQSTSLFSNVEIAGVDYVMSSFTRTYASNQTTFIRALSGHIMDGSGTTTVVFS
jgi:hypothetical protein